MSIVRYNGATPVAASLVTVYFTGTQNPATLYADDLLTPLGNPFTSDAVTGLFSYWADNGSVYDELIGAPTAVPATAQTNAAFGIVVVAGQTQVEADVPHDAVELEAGANVTITTTPASKKVTIAASGGGTPSNTVAALDGTGVAGVSSDYSRGDHRHADANRPTNDQKAALAGSSGVPSAANPYVTDADGRNTNARTPTAHESTHRSGGSDPLSVLNLAGFPGGTTDFLRADGSFATPPGAAGAGRLLGVQVITATGAGTYTPTAGTASIVIELQGGGGGAGSAASPGGGNVGIGRAGGAGGYIRHRLTANFSGASYSVGAGGAGGASGASNNGSAGGDTTFTDTAGSPTTYTAGGGALGTGGGAAAPAYVTAPGAGGTCTNGDLRIPGGAGRWGLALNTTSVASGDGGDSVFGRGGASVRSTGTAQSTAGNNATGYGAGGSGCAVTTTGASAAGGNGSDGVIVIWEYA